MASDPDLLDRRLALVEADLSAATGGASLCAVSRSGGPVDAAKYHEGRLAALLDLRRARRREVPDLAAHRAELLRDWTAELDRVRRDGLGRGWIAYRAGGVDELTELGRTEEPSGSERPTGS